MGLNVHLKDNFCECCGRSDKVFDSGLTHNLTPMADEAKIYKIIWRPEELDITKASQIIGPLKAGIQAMEADPKYYISFNPDNGWGSYNDFLPWLKKYLAACEKYPNAIIEVSRRAWHERYAEG